ncbi:MAG: hypothetical protein IT340_19930 [Chloroflexi bacterium]|nr:hypothetical protein [Chloroflexota bacterium]
MADNVNVNSGSGITVATDDIGSGVHAQKVKILDGADAATGSLFPSPAALGDAVSNPTTPLLGAAQMVWDGVQWVRMRAAVVFKTIDLGSGTTETTIWTPASGKKFRWLGGVLVTGGGTALTFKDGSGGSDIFKTRLAAAGDQTLALGPLGILSGAANNVLTVTRGTNTTLIGTVWGTEE